MSEVVKIIDSDHHVCFKDLNKFIEDLKNGLTYENIEPGNDNTIKITIEIGRSRKLYCYMNNQQVSRPEFTVTLERIDEIIRDYSENVDIVH